MFIDETNFPFLKVIKNDVNVISDEFFYAVDKYEILDIFYNSTEPTIYNHIAYWVKENKFHPEDIGYDVRNGVWSGFPIYKSGFPINWYDVKSYFPETLKLLKLVPGINFSSFMRLDPNAMTTAHKHLMKNNIYHLLINDLDGKCEFTCESFKKDVAKKGDSLMFDYSNEHSSVNLSTKKRIDFTIDFDPFLFQL